jgi:hypothetical protein
MNASTIVRGGSGGTSLPLLDTPKPSGELHVGSNIWKNWASINYVFIRLFSQAEHVRRKTQLEQSSTQATQYSRTKIFMCSAQYYEDSWLKISNQCQCLEQFDIQLGIKS